MSTKFQPDHYIYQSEISLGQRYRDDDTNFEGVAAQVTFSRNGSERVQLKALVSNVPVEHWFDAPQLTHVYTGTATGFTKDKADNGLRGK